jgi:hypothetical protein
MSTASKRVKIGNPVQMAWLLLLLGQPLLMGCSAAPPGDAFPIKFVQNTFIKEQFVYQFDDSGSVQGSPRRYWFHLDGDTKSRLHARAVSAEGDVVLRYEGSGAPNGGLVCTPVDEPDTHACGIDLKNLPKGDHLFIVTGHSARGRSYTLFVGMRSAESL